MKQLVLLPLLLNLLFRPTFSQELTEVEVDSKIKEVTVFFQGAQIVREGQFSAQSGKKYLFKIQDVETGMVRSSLQIKTPDGISIDQIDHRIKYVETENHDTEIKGIRAKLEELRIDLQEKNDKIELIGVQRAMLNENRGLSQSQSGMTVEEWKNGVAYYEQKTTELIQRQRANEREALAVQQEMEKLLERLDKISGIAKKQTIELLIEATCTKQVSNGVFRFSFLIPDAAWTPKYDLKMDGLNKPLALDVKADITQSSGNDWKNIDLILTSEDPFKSAERPILRKWNPVYGYRPKTARQDKVVEMKGDGSILGRVTDRETGEGLIGASVILMDGDQQISGASTDFDGNYKLSKAPAYRPLKLVCTFIGYNKEEREGIQVSPNNDSRVDFRMAMAAEQLETVVVSAGKFEQRTQDLAVSMTTYDAEGRPYFGSMGNSYSRAYDKKVESKVKRSDYTASTVTKGTTRVQYKLKEKFSIPSDKKPHTANIDALRINADFKHFTAPVEYDKAFLVTEITDWESFNLLDGPVSLHVDGAYVGESELNSEQAEDTLILSLGTDASIQIDRSEVKENNKRTFLSAKRVQQKSYRIKVKNTRSETVHITVQDQIPVSSDKEVEVELLESGNAKLNKETGVLEWEVEIPAGQTWETTFTFSVKYPNEMRVYID